MSSQVRTRFGRAALVVWVAMNWLVFVGLVFTGYGGVFTPFELPMAGILAMTFPLWLFANLAMLVINLIIRATRWLALVPTLAMIVAWGPILNFCPMNFFHSSTMTPQQAENSFTMLTYNCYHLVDYSGQYPDNVNPAIEYILRTDADVVALQECEALTTYPYAKLTKSQEQRLGEVYPYQYIDSTSQWNSLAILSKYPFELLPIGRIDQHDYRLIDGYRLDIKGRKVTLYNVHLQSLGLSAEDKELYRSIYKGEAETQIAAIRSQLISKIVIANVKRMAQARLLRTYIETFGGERIIVTGDFNDIAGCQAMRIIEHSGKYHFRQVYRQVGCGPLITYHAGGFLFHIDHILYSGKLTPFSIRCDKEPWSDHYPQLATFILD